MVFRRPLFVVFLCLIAWDCIWYYFGRGDSQTENTTWDSLAVHCVGQIQEIQIKTSGKVLVLEDVQVVNRETGESLNTENILVYDNSENHLFSDSKIGNIVTVKGNYSIFECASNPGEFDEKLYYGSRGISGRIFADSFTIVNHKFDWFRQGLFTLRQQAMTQLLAVMEEKDAGVLGAMILGEKNYLPTERRDMFQQTGIGHMLAISGLHISLLGAGLFLFLRTYVMPMKKAVIVTVVFLFLYGEFTGFPVATARAVLMMCCALFARYAGRSYDGLSALSLSGIITLLQEPLQLFQCGFLLSYTAVGGILLLAPVMEKITPLLKKRKGWEKILQSLLPSVFIFLFTLPVMLWFFYEICPYSVLANLLVLPFLALLIGVGIGGCVLSFLWQDGGGFLLSTAHYILKFYDLVCRLVENLPYSHIITGRPSLLFLVMYYTILVGMVYLYLRWEKKLVSGVCGILLGTVLMQVSPEFEFVYVQLDVGQGDCACIIQGDRTYLIDGGSSSEKEIGKYTIQKFLKYYGRSRIDGIFITHSDADHTNGVVELVSNQKEWGISIERIIMPQIEKKDEGYITLSRNFAEFNTKVITMKKGDWMAEESFRISCLHPAPDYEWESENDYSLTLDITYQNLRILTTGDLEESGEKTIEKIQGGYDVLKAGHHGSKTSTSDGFLDMLMPENAIISAGRTNRYGHPSPVTLEKLQSREVIICNTMEGGAVFVEKEEGHKRIWSYRKGARDM